MERAERSGGLHKRSAEAWGHPLRARGAELPLAVFVVVFAFEKIRAGVAGRNRPAEVGGGGPGGRSQGGGVLPSNGQLTAKMRDVLRKARNGLKEFLRCCTGYDKNISLCKSSP